VKPGPAGMSRWIVDYVLLVSIMAHMVMCPYTKVEESFNIQAMHDVILYGSTLINYDHFSFPGVVPRTFLGALVVSAVLCPVSVVCYAYISSASGDVFIYQYMCRAVVGLIVWVPLCHLRDAVSSSYGQRVALLFSLLLSLQFHIPFYATRTLPNTFALAAVIEAYALWIQKQPRAALCVVGAAMVVFRCDLLVLLCPLALQMLVAQEVPFFSTLAMGVGTCFCALVLTVIVDSYFWNRLLWPEGIVLFFNTVSNRSSEWGVYPWHWYFTSAIPRALHLSLPLVAVGLSGFKLSSYLSPVTTHSSAISMRTLWYHITPVFAFTTLYSFLPHKELRFIFVVFPVLTIAAAVGLHNTLPDYRTKTVLPAVYRIMRTIVWVGFAVFVVGMLLLTWTFSVAAQHNYPGGEALSILNKHVLSSYETTANGVCIYKYGKQVMPLRDCNISVHIHATAAMTGVTRFLQLNTLCLNDSVLCSTPTIRYSKDENENLDYDSFDWLVGEYPEYVILPAATVSS